MPVCRTLSAALRCKSQDVAQATGQARPWSRAPIEAGETTIRELARMLPGTDVQAAVHALEVLTVAEAERRSAVPAS